MNQVNPSVLAPAFVTCLLASLAFAFSLGALFWRMRAAEARIRVLEDDQAAALDLIGKVQAQMSGLDATIRGLTSSIQGMPRRVR